jgi:hypothetical protein
MKTKQPKTFNLNDEFERYLNIVELDKRIMPPDQLRELKRAFYGACGQLLILTRDEVGALPDEEAIEALQDLLNQVANFWNNENNKQN